MLNVAGTCGITASQNIRDVIYKLRVQKTHRWPTPATAPYGLCICTNQALIKHGMQFDIVHMNSQTSYGNFGMDKSWNSKCRHESILLWLRSGPVGLGADRSCWPIC
jgi:hypothetical protein